MSNEAEKLRQLTKLLESESAEAAIMNAIDSLENALTQLHNVAEMAGLDPQEVYNLQGKVNDIIGRMESYIDDGNQEDSDDLPIHKFDI